LNDEDDGLALLDASDPVTAGLNAAAWSPGSTGTGIGNAASGIGAGHLSWEQGQACKAPSRAVKAATDKQAERSKCLNIQPDDSVCDKDHDGDQAAGGTSKDGSAHCGTFGFIYECKGKLVNPTWMPFSQPPYPQGVAALCLAGNRETLAQHSSLLWPTHRQEKWILRLPGAEISLLSKTKPLILDQNLADSTTRRSTWAEQDQVIWGKFF